MCLPTRPDPTRPDPTRPDPTRPDPNETREEMLAMIERIADLLEARARGDATLLSTTLRYHEQQR
ncbi:hypothetical protein OKW39_008032 [Paraburkholderia sp. MM6662-R1]